jgi:hypothetical protein
MKNTVQAPLVIFVTFVAVCISSCDRQAPQTEAPTSSKEVKPARITTPANLSNSNIRGKLLDGKAALKQVASINITWTNGNEAAAKRQLSELVELHRSLSQTPVYESALVSADCELRLCNSIVPALINGQLSPAEAQSTIASIAANRFNNASLAAMLNESAPDSKQARTLAAELNSGRSVNLIEASNALLREQGASLLDGPTPDRLGELLDKPNAARAFQYNAMMGAKLDVAKVIAAYASAGGNLHADDATVAASLLEKVPKLVNAPGAITNRPIRVKDVVHYLAKWRNGTFVR